MESKLSDILDNILGLLLLEGTYDIADTQDGLMVSIETKDAGRLIGFKGETLAALQLLVNQMITKEFALSPSTALGIEGFKRVILDVSSWRSNKEADLKEKAKLWIGEVKDSGKLLELEPMPSWQRRIIHMMVSESEKDGVESESVGEGRDRHIVIKLKAQMSNVKTKEA